MTVITGDAFIYRTYVIFFGLFVGGGGGGGGGWGS